MSADLAVIVGGAQYSNWTRWSVDRDLLEPSDAWSLTVADPAPEQLAAVTEGELVTLRLADQTLVRGYVDRRDFSGGREGDELTISGRSLTAPLVDCCVLPNWRKADLSIVRIAELALAELGVALTVTAGAAEASETISHIKPEPGETWWDLLTRFCKRARVMMWDTSTALVIGRPTYAGKSAAELRWWPGQSGTNILRAEVSWNTSIRRSPIIIMGQRRGSDSIFGESATVKQSVSDPILGELGLLRPLVMTESGLESNASALRRATTELSRRAGEALVARYTVPGFGPNAKTVWTPDTLVDVSDRRTGLEEQLWISAARIEGGRDGARSTLTLRTLGAILPEAA